MPIINAHIPSGFSTPQKHDLLRQATDAICAALDAPIASTRITLIEHCAEDTMVAGVVGAQHVLFIAYLIEGRTDALKAALISALNQVACEALGMSAQDVRSVVQDVPKASMGVAGGISALAAGR